MVFREKNKMWETYKRFLVQFNNQSQHLHSPLPFIDIFIVYIYIKKVKMSSYFCTAICIHVLHQPYPLEWHNRDISHPITSVSLIFLQTNNQVGNKNPDYLAFVWQIQRWIQSPVDSPLKQPEMRWAFHVIMLFWNINVCTFIKFHTMV